MIKLIIGLGNPDPKYQNTYHNIGALFAKYFQDCRNRQQFISSELSVLVSKAYVNESGKFVAKELKKSGAKAEKLLIAHDDSDIELGQYKFSFGRGAAGHHGIESIQTALKTKDFWRLRIGIRSTRQKALEFVLKKITASDKKILEEVFEKILEDTNWKLLLVKY